MSLHMLCLDGPVDQGKVCRKEDQLQLIHNSEACVLTKIMAIEQITPVLKSSLIYKSLNISAPKYIK